MHMKFSSKSQRDMILAETQAYSELIANKDWSLLEQYVKQRQVKLEELFATPIPDEEKPALLDFVSEIQSLDEKHKELIAKTKISLAKETTNLKSGYQAIQAYSDVHEQ